MGKACSTHEGEEECIKSFVGKLEEKRPLGRPKRRSEDNIKMHVREMGWGGMDWIHLAQGRD
jgi:hypothetical protein